MICPNCAFDNLPEARYCGMCGAHLARVCPTCGTANSLEYRFCYMCGIALGEWKLPSGLVASVAPRSQVSLPATAAARVGEERPAQQLEGERRVATVILADVQSSTNLIERLGSETWVGIMNRVFQILEAEIYRFGGMVDQFRGDGLVAFFGATVAHEDDPERAVMAALFMQQAIQQFAAELSASENINLQLRVGVNTGEVIVASVGDSRQHREDTAMGEAVALAARMETAAQPGTVLVSENTYRLTGSKFEWQPLGEITVKGISQPVRVYRPVASRPEIERVHEVAADDEISPPTGRAAEFETLVRCVEDLRDSRGRIVMIAGDKGMGKSFLISRVRGYLIQQWIVQNGLEAGDWSPPKETHGEDLIPPVTWLRGSCRSYDQSLPYSLWLDLLQRWLGAYPEEPAEEKRVRLHQQAEILWREQADQYYPYLATFLGLPLEESFLDRVRFLNAQGLQGQFFLTIRGWVEAMARRGPLILGFSDLHWADSTSLELLKSCLPLCDRESLLWMLSFRPERSSLVWQFRHYVETEYPHRLASINLHALSEAESNELIDRLTCPTALSENTRALIIAKAEGNPYYIREIVNTLAAQGVLVQDPQTGDWSETRLETSLELPDSLQSLLLARIDRLSSEERRLLQMAAVIGPLFWRNVLQALAGDSDHLITHLTSLQRVQLIQERSQIPVLGMEYAFSSSLVRDVAYESLLSAQRAAHHLKVAEFLECCLDLGSWSRYNSLAAYHYRYAGKHDKELLYTHKAAEQARCVYANTEALGHYSRALELLDEMESHATSEGQLYAIRTQRFEVLSRRREVQYLVVNLQEGDLDSRTLLALARQIADHPAWLIDALLSQPEVNRPETREELNAGLPMAQEALKLSRELGDRHRELRSLTRITDLRFLLRDPTWREAGEYALQLARQLGDRQTEVSLLLGIGSAYGMDDLERNVEYLRAALDISQKLDDKETEIRLLGAIGAQYERSGDYYRLLTEYEQKRLRICREIGDRLAEGEALMFCGQIQGLYLGDYEAGLSMVKESFDIWEGATTSLFSLLRIAQIQVEQGKHAEARATLERAYPLCERNIYDLGRAGFDLVSAIFYNAMQTEAHFRKALEYAAKICQMVAENLISSQYQMAASCESAVAHLGLADCVSGEAERSFHLRQALESSQSALEIYTQFGFVQIIECTSEEILFHHHLALTANGRASEAAEYLKRAHDEMMRKFALIPTGVPFRRTYLEGICLHREIREAYAALVAKALE